MFYKFAVFVSLVRVQVITIGPPHGQVIHDDEDDDDDDNYLQECINVSNSRDEIRIKWLQFMLQINCLWCIPNR